MLVYVDRSRVHDGRLDDLRSGMADLAAFVEANEPGIRSYNVYFTDDGTRMTVIHVHDDPESLAFHVEVAGPEFPAVGEYLTLESIDVYGRPGEDVVRALRAKASSLGTGSVTIHDHHRGFDRVGDE